MGYVWFGKLDNENMNGNLKLPSDVRAPDMLLFIICVFMNEFIY